MPEQEREHGTSMDCWCNPRVESYGDGGVINRPSLEMEEADLRPYVRVGASQAEMVDPGLDRPDDDA